jgi:Putative zinc-finger
MMGLGDREPRMGCRWVRDRLPLLVGGGGELEGSERRKAERHLLACADCRRERATLARTVGVLHAAAAVVPSPVESASLWPALQRQIREARHEPRRSVVSVSFSPLAEFAAWLEARLRLRPAMALALVLAGLTALGVTAWSRSRTAVATAQELANSRPLETWPDFGFGPEMFSPELVDTAISQAANITQADPAPTIAYERPSSASRIDYDLDHGTPMGPDARGFKSSY